MRVLRYFVVFAVGLSLVTSALFAGTTQQGKAPAQLNPPASRDARRVDTLKEELRHQLVMLPYYSVFDWLQAEVKADGSVTLMGEVTRPTTKDDAGNRAKRLESVEKVVNNIEVLPVSPSDDNLRVALYRAIFRFESPLFRYATQSVPPIHIIVKNGRVTLKGVVLNQMDSQLAYTAAQGVSGVFEVKNELQVEQKSEPQADQKATKK